MKKIIVTGGAGYIGSHTVVELFHAGYQSIVIDNFVNANKSVLTRIESIIGEPVKLYEGDCNDADFLNEVFKAEPDIAGVIHFAAHKAVGESVQEPLKYFQNNLGGLMTLLDVMKAHAVTNLVFSSSCVVYGEPDTLPVTELSPIKPAESPYGKTKQMCEEIIADVVKGNGALKSIALRYFNPIGAHPSALIGELPLGVPANLIPFVTQSAAGIRGKITVFGADYDTADGTCIRDYIHVVDLAKAHVKSLDYLEQQEETCLFDVFNIGTGEGNSVMEVLKTFEDILGRPLDVTIGERRAGDVIEVYANASKANQLLDWKADISLKQAMIDAWRWQQKQ